MAEDPGDALEIDALAQHLAGGRVTKDMGSGARPPDAGALHRSARNVADGASRSKWSERSHDADEDALALNVRPNAQVIQHGVTDVLRERQPDFASALTGHSDRGCVETQIRRAKTGYVPGAEPEPDQEKKNRSIANTRHGRRAGAQNLLDLLGAQPARKGLLRPIGRRDQGMLQTWTALPLGGEVAQEHPHGGQHHPDGVSPVVPVALGDELS